MINILKSARVVIFNEEDKLAIIEVGDSLYHKVPGGIINPKEGRRDAAHRKAREEGGSIIEIMSKIGDYEFTSLEGMKFHSSFYLAKKIKNKKGPNFEDWQRSNNFKLNWVRFDDAVRMFENPKTKKSHQLSINKRDFKFVKDGWNKYLKIINKKKKVLV